MTDLDLTAAAEAGARYLASGQDPTGTERMIARGTIAAALPATIRAIADRMARESHDRHIGVGWLRALADEVAGGGGR